MVKYPIGMQDFKEIREKGFLYVDKTHFIPLLLRGSKYFFLARPRRFGKSLFLSTLEYFFHGDRSLFNHLEIDSFEWDWTNYPVIHFDFSGANYTVEKGMETRIAFALNEYEKLFGVNPLPEFPLEERFRNLIIQTFEKTGKQIVVLVDEYEKPVIDNLDNSNLFEHNRNFLRGFYSVLKSCDKYLKLVFLTGVTRFGQMSVFSGLNNIRDISMNPLFASICGVTEKELVHNFSRGIQELADAENTDFQGALQLLKYNYDGYHFTKNSQDIFNPYSLINCLEDKSIKPYWSFTGTPSLLAKLLISKDYNLEMLDGVMASEETLMGINNQFDDPVALFYQTGYLTIKSYDKDLDEFVLGYPNKEVEKAFFQFILPYYYKHRNNESESVIGNLNRFIIKGEAEKAVKALQSFSSGISYDLIPNVEVERHFQSMMYIVVKLLASFKVKITPEWKTSDGRIDLLIETPKFVYIIEIKRNSNPEEAMKQIYNKNYFLPFVADSKKVFLVGMNFSTEKKRLDGFIIKEVDR